MRCAIFFLPPQQDRLCADAATWLRRDPYTGAAVTSPATGLTEEEHALYTAVPRRYGFHASIKAPFRLAERTTPEQLGLRLGVFLARIAPFALDLTIERLDSFYALVPAKTVPQLYELAADVVAEFDHFRAPFEEGELARRNVSQLTERQLSHLISWGDPYVFDQYQFHMALTGPVPAGERPKVEDALAAHFGAETHRVEVSQLAIAVEPVPNAPFRIQSLHPLAQPHMHSRLTA